MEFTAPQLAWLAENFNDILKETNTGKNEALRQKDGNLAAAFLAQNQGVREFLARVLQDDTLTDPEQCPFLVI